MLKTVFSDNKIPKEGTKIPKENTKYIYVAEINIDSVMKIDKKSYPQVYLEECKI